MFFKVSSQIKKTTKQHEKKIIQKEKVSKVYCFECVFFFHLPMPFHSTTFLRQNNKKKSCKGRKM